MRISRTVRPPCAVESLCVCLWSVLRSKPAPTVGSARLGFVFLSADSPEASDDLSLPLPPVGSPVEADDLLGKDEERDALSSDFVCCVGGGCSTIDSLGDLGDVV